MQIWLWWSKVILTSFKNWKFFKNFEIFRCSDINECFTGPCDDKEICENIDGSFNCLCSVGFNDDQCLETDYLDCGSYHCYNGGHCAKKVSLIFKIFCQIF